MTTIVMLPTPPAAAPARSAQPSRSGAPDAASDRDFARTLDEVSGRQDRTTHDDAPADVPGDAPEADAGRADAAGAHADDEGRPDGTSASAAAPPVRPTAMLLSVAQIVQAAAGALDAAAGSQPVDGAAVLTAAGAAGAAAATGAVTPTADGTTGPATSADGAGSGDGAGPDGAGSDDGDGPLAAVIDLGARRAAHVPTQRGTGGTSGAAGDAVGTSGARPAADPATLGAPPAPLLGPDAPTGGARLFAVDSPAAAGVVATGPVAAEAPATPSDGAGMVRVTEATSGASTAGTQAPAAAVGVSPTAAPSATAPTAPATAPATTPTPAEVPLAEQLSGRLTSLRSAGPGQHVLTLRVDPESIGPVRVVAHIGAEGVRIELFGATDQAREALRQAMPDLRRDLVAAGLPGGLDLGTGSGPGLRGQGTGTGTDGGGSGQGRAPGEDGPARTGAETATAPTTPTTGGHAAHLDLLV